MGMRKLMIMAVCFMPIVAFGADKKITELTADNSPSAGYQIVTVTTSSNTRRTVLSTVAGALDHTDLGAGIGSNAHSVVDTHLASATPHVLWQDSGAGTIDTSNYVDNDTTDHTSFSNIGTNTHAQIDTALATVATSTDTNATNIATNISDITALEVSTGTNKTAIALNTTHRGSDGSDHSFIDQDVTIGAAPTLDGSNFTNLSSGVTDHLQLSNTGQITHDGLETSLGLTLLTDGSRALAGAWDMDDQIITNINIDSGRITGIVDLAVPDGGTGAGTFTDHGVLLGSGSGTLSVTGTGSSGEVLTSNGSGSDPTFQTSIGSADNLSFNISMAAATTTYLAAIDFPTKSIEENITITSVTFTCDSGTVTGIDLSFADANTPYASGTDILTGTISANTTAQGASGFENAAIPSGNVIKMISSGITGTPTKLYGRVAYTIDR